MEKQTNHKTLASHWLKSKMKEKFDRDFNLENEYTMHEEGDSVKIALTPETSTISQQELLSLSFFVDQINNSEVDFENGE